MSILSPRTREHYINFTLLYKKVNMNSLEHNLPCLETLIYIVHLHLRKCYLENGTNEMHFSKIGANAIRPT